MLVLGIDPGTSGALALLDAPGGLRVWDMPVNEIKIGQTKRRRVDILGLSELLDSIAIIGCDRIVVEEVNAMPRNSGMFAFGFGVGVIHTLLTEKRLRFDLITPAKWKRDVKAPRDKAEAIVRAEELFPQHRGLWRYKATNGKDATRPDRAEAALLAFWGATCR